MLGSKFCPTSLQRDCHRAPLGSPALHNLSAVWALQVLCMCFLAGESHWEISLAQAHGVSHGPGTEINSIVSLFCCLENSDQKLQPLKSCECWVHLQLWSVELTWIPRSGTILGSPGLTPAVFLQPFLCPISLCFSLDSSGCFFMPRHSPSLGVHVPLSPQEAAVPVCGERAWGALLSPLSPDSVHHLAWGKIVILFFINLFVPQSLIWGKKKKRGWTQLWKATWELCMQHGATLSWISMYLAVSAFIHIQQLHLEGGSNAQISVEKPSPFPFKKTSKAGKLAVLIHLAPWVQHDQSQEAAREGSRRY